MIYGAGSPHSNGSAYKSTRIDLAETQPRLYSRLQVCKSSPRKTWSISISTVNRKDRKIINKDTFAEIEIWFRYRHNKSIDDYLVFGGKWWHRSQNLLSRVIRSFADTLATRHTYDGFPHISNYRAHTYYIGKWIYEIMNVLGPNKRRSPVGDSLNWLSEIHYWIQFVPIPNLIRVKSEWVSTRWFV